MMLRLYPSALFGSVLPPPSKSLLHRELICRCLAGQLTDLPPHAARDVLATARGLEQLTAAAPVIDCGESGSTLRFLLPLFMALGRTDAVFLGTERLLHRPIPADLGLQPIPGGLRLTRPLRSGRWTLSASETSQVVSGLLLSLPLLTGDSEIMFTDKTVSRPYIDMTAAVMCHHGVRLERHDTTWYIPGGQVYHPASPLQEPDWSAAAYWLVLSAAQKRRGGAPLDIPMGRAPYLQGDAAALRYVNEMPAELDISATPDLLPPLSLCAALRPGVTTRFTHAAFLRRKESDRLAAVAALLQALGADVAESPDGLCVTGTATLHGGEVESCGDHRIAMLAGCAAMLADGAVTLHGAEAVAKSYPAFWRDLAALGGRWEVLEA